MAESKISEGLGKLIKNLLMFSHRFATRHTIPLIASVLVVLVAWQSWNVYEQYRTSHLSFLVGPWSPESMEESRRIKESIESGKKKELVGTSYSLKLEETSGYEENRRRINGDDEGRIAGFAYDGFGDSENLAIVLPLDKRYLRILCHTKYIDELNKQNQQRPLPLKTIFQSLDPGRVYLGARDSATRMCAEIVLRHFGIKDEDIDRLRCYGVGDFSEIRAALANHHIDMAFSSGGFDSKTISSIAQDGHCVLLGLNEERDAIVQANPHLLSVDFEENSYASGKFCPETKETIGARRVIVCSDRMASKDVFTLGLSAFNALRNEIPEIEWETPPRGFEKTKWAPLRYRLHPGAELIREKQEPPNPYPWLSVFLASIAVWSAAEIIRLINSLFERSLARRTSPPPEDIGQPDAYKNLKMELETYVHELERADMPLDGAAFDSWEEKISDLRTRILEANRSGRLGRENTHALLTGLRRELSTEHEIRSPMQLLRAASAEPTAF